MDIEDAFTQEAIEAAGTDVGGAEEDELSAVIGRVCQAHEVELTQPEMVVATLCFIAGRTYQYDATMINIPMSPLLVAQFMRFLSGGGE